MCQVTCEFWKFASESFLSLLKWVLKASYTPLKAGFKIPPAIILNKEFNLNIIFKDEGFWEERK